jgi:hypothetical protein
MKTPVRAGRNLIAVLLIGALVASSSFASAHPASAGPRPATLSSELSVGLTSSVQSGTVPLSVTFNATASGGYAPYSFVWSFGDGTSPGTGPGVVHVYLTPGTFLAIVNVTDVYGEPGNASVTIVVAPPPLSAVVSASPSSLPVGSATYLEANATGGTPPYFYAWTGLPLGCVAGDYQSIRCVPTVPGGFTVTVTVTDSQSGHSTSIAALVVSGNASTHAPGGSGGTSELPLYELVGLAAVAVLAGLGVGMWLRARSRGAP